MLAATSSRSDRTLDSIRLVLLLEAKEQDYPETLKSHFKMILEQSLQLLNSPTELISSALPEAVTLAIKMSSDEALFNALEPINTIDDITSDLAKIALSSLEASFDTDRKPAHFSQDIYSAI